MNINMFSLLDYAGRDLQRLIISRKNYQGVANLFYWKRHYDSITSISRLFSNKTKHDNIKEVLARHTELCKQPPTKIQLIQRIFIRLCLYEIYLHRIFDNFI